MKYLSFLLALALSHIVCAQVVQVEIEGIYMIRYNKNDVIECNQPGVSCFDYPSKDYFFTLSVNGEINLKDYNDIRIILQNPEYRNLEVFSFPPFSCNCDSILKAQNITSQTCSVSLGKNYYLLDGDSSNLYKYMHFKASALRTIIFNDYLDKNSVPSLAIEWRILPSTVDLNAPGVYNYILYDIEIINEPLPVWLTPFHFDYSNN